MNKILLMSIIIAWINLSDTQGQNSSTSITLPEVIHKSPEIASYERFGEFSINEASGNPNISIPLHKIKIGGLEVPINLSYNASGILVNQEATVVGLGWNLIAGGNIIYKPIGTDEREKFGNDNLYSGDEYNWKVLMDPYSGSSYSGDGAQDPGINTRCGGNTFDLYQGDITSQFDIVYKKGLKWDACAHEVSPSLSNYYATLDCGERDVYMVNFLGYSYSFIRHPITGDIIFIGQKPKHIITKNNSVFTITDERGTKYYFYDREYISDTGKTNAWYLSAIEDLEGNQIEFSYENFGPIYSIPTLQETYTYDTSINNESSANRKISTLYTKVNNLVLTEIKTNIETVTFTYSNNREDLTGEGKRRLDNIEVKANADNITIKEYEFNYNYFEGENYGGDYLNDDNVIRNIDPYPSEESLKKRLKLISINQYGLDKDVRARKHSFTYNEVNKLPWKTSFSRDFWGYYNGQENYSNIFSYMNGRRTIIPDPKLYNDELNDGVEFVDGIYDLNGAIRSVDKDYITLGMLKSITYPTGGVSEFEFEPNNSYSDYGGNVEDKKNLYSYPSYRIMDYNDNFENSPSNKKEEFTLTKKTTITITPSFNMYNYSYDQIRNTYVKLSKKGSSSTIVQYNIADNEDLWVKEFELDPGTYIFECDLDERIPFNGLSNLKHIVNALLSYTVKNDIPWDINTNYCEGVRIKSITNRYNNENTYKKEYSYKPGYETRPNQYYKMQGYRYNMKYDNNIPGGCTSFVQYKKRHTLSSFNMLTSSSPHINSPSISYRAIETEEISDNKNNGKIISTYSSYSFTISGERFFYSEKNNMIKSGGNLKQRLHLDANGDTVSLEKYSYKEIDQNRIILNTIINKSIVEGAQTNCMGWPYYNEPFYYITTYASKSYYNYLWKKETIDFYKGRKVSNWIEYNYNENNYQLHEVKRGTSKGQETKTTYTYPHNFTDGVYPQMVAKNQITPVIEQSIYLDNELLEYNKTDYEDFEFPYKQGDYIKYKTLYLPSIVYAQTRDNTLEERINYNEYDYYGNIISISKSDSDPIIYVWGYNQQYPIAKIENATYSQVENVITVSNIQALSNLDNDHGIRGSETKEDALRQALDALREIEGAMVTTYTYDPLIGMTSQTDPNGRTTYYEYDDFGRLEYIRDQDGNIIKKYEYNYATQTSN